MTTEPRFSAPPTALTIAGSDNSAGAGIQADLKTFSHFGVYGLTAITCVVAEVPGLVKSIQAIEPQIVAEQIELSLEHFPMGALKTGMLYSIELIEAVVAVLRDRAGAIPVVVDPVMVATSGDPLLQNNAVEAYRTQLLPMATLVTPNLDEAGVLLGCAPMRTVEEMEHAGKELSARFGTAFLMKGGHLPGGSAVDLLIDGDQVWRYEAPFVRNVMTHGTGCTYSAAITAQLARGLPLPEAVAKAKTYVFESIRQSFLWKADERTVMALNHFAQEPI
ncbi:MAG TPA: bifunctional hydroxymethylpyrimidine kinase/phosphomethylpyrimidine kinase [Chthoniobacterales bacterium]|jgi:hydroxymethylpyrimidine/phosphomethylpyrimidine kinase